jgi:hypothetical protein
MKQSDADAGGRKLLPSGARLASGAVAALLLLMGSGAKAEVVEETFYLSGSFNSFSFFGPPTAFTGTIDLDFSNNFADQTVKSIEITVNGRPVFNQNASIHLAMSANGVVNESNSQGDMLTFMFKTFKAGTWAHFNEEPITGGQVIFGDLTGAFLGASGLIFRDQHQPEIPDRPDPPSVPELSTWVMMLVGLAGLGLATRPRRALGSLGGRA